jgi:YkoY family integral membrane protein
MIPILISLLVIVLIEGVLSFDNAAVLAVIVNKKLKDPIERKKALRWGMLGAFIFRGFSLAIVSWLMFNPWVGDWFRVLGGLFLLRLGYKGLTPEVDSIEEGKEPKWASKLLNWLKISPFWSTVFVVEIADLVFSLDNLVAVVSLSNIFWVVCVGVCLGIITMRYVATKFTELIQRFPSLEKSAMIVILILGFKLMFGGLAGLLALTGISNVMLLHSFDIWFSIGMMAIFFGPIIKQKLI